MNRGVVKKVTLLNKSGKRLGTIVAEVFPNGSAIWGRKLSPTSAEICWGRIVPPDNIIEGA